MKKVENVGPSTSLAKEWDSFEKSVGGAAFTSPAKEQALEIPLPPKRSSPSPQRSSRSPKRSRLDSKGKKKSECLISLLFYLYNTLYVPSLILNFISFWSSFSWAISGTCTQ